MKEIRLQGEVKPDKSMDTLVEVTMEVLPDTFELMSNGTEIRAEERLKLLSTQQYVKAGIRAKLGTESLVTGQLLVEIDFRPDTDAVYRARKPGGPPRDPYHHRRC